MRRRAERALCLLACCGALLCGCEAGTAEDVFQALGDLYQEYGPGSLEYDLLDPWYPWRYTFHHDAWAGVSPVPVRDGVPLFTESELDAWREGREPAVRKDDLDRTVQVCAVCTDPLPAGDTEEALPDPPGWHQQLYPGTVPGNLYRKLHLLPEAFGGGDGAENLTAVTAYLYAALEEQISEIRQYREEYPEDRVLWRLSVIYDRTAVLCEGVLLECQTLDTEGLRICSYFYNVQPGIVFSRWTGASRLEAESGAGDTENDGAPDASSEDLVP